MKEPTVPMPPVPGAIPAWEEVPPSLEVMEHDPEQALVDFMAKGKRDIRIAQFHLRKLLRRYSGMPPEGTEDRELADKLIQLMKQIADGFGAVARALEALNGNKEEE